MKKSRSRTTVSALQVEIFTVTPAGRYDVKTAARLAGVPSKTILSYHRAGLIPAVGKSRPSHPKFSDESILLVRRIERLRSHHGINLAGIKMIVELMDELNRLHSEVRFWRE